MGMVTILVVWPKLLEKKNMFPHPKDTPHEI